MVLSLFLCLFFALSLSLSLHDTSKALQKKFGKTLTEKINFNRYVLAVPCRPLEIAIGLPEFSVGIPDWLLCGANLTTGMLLADHTMPQDSLYHSVIKLKTQTVIVS